MCKKIIEIFRIEYIFVHFMHPYHSTKFYEMLATMMPDWKARKKHLEATAFSASE